MSKLKIKLTWQFPILCAVFWIAGGIPAAFSEAIPPLLTIESPTDGTIVKRGETITVTVRAPDGLGLDLVAILGNRDISDGVGSGGPTIYHIPITIKQRAPISSVPLKILGKISGNGNLIGSNVIKINIDNGIALSSIKADPQSLDYSIISGGNTTIFLKAKFVDGSSELVGRAQAYVSDNADVAKVDKEGRVMSTGPGATNIHVTFRDKTVDIPVTVDENANGDLDGNKKVNQDDLDIIRKILNTAALGKNDPRDLNHDGKIDAVDARLLVNLCTKARCVK